MLVCGKLLQKQCAYQHCYNAIFNVQTNIYLNERSVSTMPEAIIVLIVCNVFAAIYRASHSKVY